MLILTHLSLRNAFSLKVCLMRNYAERLRKRKQGKWTVQYPWGLLVLFLFKECRGKRDLNQMGWNKTAFHTPYLPLVNHIHQAMSRIRGNN